MNKELFLKNTQALFEVDQLLAYKLRALNNPNHYIIEDMHGLNISNNMQKIYKNPKQELLENLIYFQTHYKKYPVLFFYGFGNGMLYKTLCKNKNHKHIVVFEDNLEILTLALHLTDFSTELKSEKLILFYTPNLTTAQLNTLFTYPNIYNCLKIYQLHIHSHFYERLYSNQIKNLNAKIIEIIKFLVLNYGNSPKDSLIGIKHTLNNLPKLLTHGVFQNLLKERKGKVKNAVIVSTGPSLIKQLPLLKKYSHKMTVFCVDSSYAILAKSNIKPDYVLSLERIDYTSELFNNNFQEFDKNILFIIASLTHKNTLNYLEKNNRTYMLVHRPLESATMLKLDEFGYIGVGHSVANMAYELASALRHENIILIGQDLAYDNDGNSHPKDYLYLEKADTKDNTSTLAYGKNGKVKTTLTWNLFRQDFEKDIFWTKEKLNINTYNCTEGGAHIEGTLEKPFAWVCENLLHENLEKPFAFPQTLTKNESDLKLNATKKILENAILKANDFIKKSQKELKRLEFELKKDEADIKTLEKIKNNLMALFKEYKKLKLFNEISKALYFHNECEIIKYQVLKDEEQKHLLIDFLKLQYNWFIQGLGYLDTQNKTIKKALENWYLDDIDKKN
ncbi:motility associated factor glycosyltransferase family protein [Campylobacter jejuni]|uniref:motility associated factor glycosyltransferase family protein n=1 Tax=Campylobacter jejuni TaxID=197 RepID=UPI001285910A|nr:motility associated factor glycosyltransferase family protein [Campylobacter jejuni]EAK5229692.1 motility associated factor glycosyltransferase family protein [Campylobacter jejuni]ECR1615462.1 motility associated factor glycosyltransferase family protein [Campylobacter jejuni]EDP2874114.1 DUF115 domain-containing protein [Campylobacter jejuni]EGA4021989.1 motility associated factor glycosyltransferase family protein [Campylobacter jejuni]GML90454.1 motility associated factor glycosyltransf